MKSPKQLAQEVIEGLPITPTADDSGKSIWEVKEDVDKVEKAIELALIEYGNSLLEKCADMVEKDCIDEPKSNLEKWYKTQSVLLARSIRRMKY